ncbi:hypothetical protein QE152_g4375 [Popillia japonica]|uniref:Uncharacterized protein n=1 Tax=Popillia japonica TaxID=7064 RepID=A0AAW1MV50_POPJA
MKNKTRKAILNFPVRDDENFAVPRLYDPLYGEEQQAKKLRSQKGFLTTVSEEPPKTTNFARVAQRDIIVSGLSRKSSTKPISQTVYVTVARSKPELPRGTSSLVDYLENPQPNRFPKQSM